MDDTCVIGAKSILPKALRQFQISRKFAFWVQIIQKVTCPRKGWAFVAFCRVSGGSLFGCLREHPYMESNDVILSWSSSLYTLLDVRMIDGGSPCNSLLERRSADSQHGRGLRLDLPALPIHDPAPPASSSLTPPLSSLLFCWLCNAPRHTLFPGIPLSVLALTTKTHCWIADSSQRPTSQPSSTLLH